VLTDDPNATLESVRLTSIKDTLNNLDQTGTNPLFGGALIPYNDNRLTEVYTAELENNSSDIYKLFEILKSSNDKRQHKLFNYINRKDTQNTPIMYKYLQPVSDPSFIEFNVKLVKDDTFKNKGNTVELSQYTEMKYNPIFSDLYYRLSYTGPIYYMISNFEIKNPEYGMNQITVRHSPSDSGHTTGGLDNSINGTGTFVLRDFEYAPNNSIIAEGTFNFENNPNNPNNYPGPHTFTGGYSSIDYVNIQVNPGWLQIYPYSSYRYFEGRIDFYN
jgi:hypothetical protein